jgi:hypothetical protein
MFLADPRYIDIGARGAVWLYYAHIYTAGVRTPDPPTTYESETSNLPDTRSQNSKIQGDRYRPLL